LKADYFGSIFVWLGSSSSSSLYMWVNSLLSLPYNAIDVINICGKKHVIKESRPLTHPEVVHNLDRLLELDRNVHGDVVIETGSHG